MPTASCGTRMSQPSNKPASSRLLAKNAVWNFTGLIAPLIVALYAIPILIEGMGSERFGLLAVIWVGVGYFSLFDFGLGRALTKLISERLGSGQISDLGSLIWTALVVLFAVSLVGSFLIATCNPILVERLLDINHTLNDEARIAFYLLAVGIPVVVLTTGFIGVLEAHQQFKVIAKIRMPLGIFTYLGPLLTMQFTPSVGWATGILLFGRMVAAIFYYRAACNAEHSLAKFIRPKRLFIKPLTSFGGWITVTNIIGPLMTYMDRFFIGAITGLSAVTYYVTPYEILVRLQMVSQAIVGVIFPAVSSAYASNMERFNALYVQGSKVLYWLMLPLLSGVILFGPEALEFWLGSEFHEISVPILYWLSIGWMVNIIAQPASVILQATGRPDLTAKAHMVEFVFYSIGLVLLLTNFGIVGAAMAWVIRVVMDTLALNYLVMRVLPVVKAHALRTIFVTICTIVFMAALVWIESHYFRALVLVAVICSSLAFAVPFMRTLIRKSHASSI